MSSVGDFPKNPEQQGKLPANIGDGAKGMVIAC
jgi:hypothetical protein